MLYTSGLCLHGCRKAVRDKETHELEFEPTYKLLMNNIAKPNDVDQSVSFLSIYPLYEKLDGMCFLTSSKVTNPVIDATNHLIARISELALIRALVHSLNKKLSM